MPAPKNHPKAPIAPAQEGGAFTRNELMIVLTVGLAALLQVVDATIVNVAVPTMMGNLGATLDEIGWVVTGYIVTNAIVLPISGWLGIRFGRRSYLLTCILLFTATSVACGLAPNLWTLVFFRLIQGAAGGALLPTSQAIIQELFPGKRSGIGSSLFGIVVIVGPTIGPPLGGWLTDHMGWRWIFYINLPLGLLAAFLTTLFVTDYSVEGEHAAAHQRMRSAPIDGIGLALLTLWVGCLQFVLERGGPDDWFSSPTILTLTLIGCIALPVFVWWEWIQEYPIVDLKLFKKMELANGTLIMALVGGIISAGLFFIPFFSTNILGMDATQTGNLFMPSSLAMGVMMPIVGALLYKYEARYFMLGGMAVTALGMYMLTYLTPQSGYWDLYWPLMVRGIGLPGIFIPLNAMVLGAFRGPSLGQAAGMMNLSRQLGGSLGIAVLSVFFDNASDRAYDHLRQFISPLTLGFSQWAQSAQALVYRFADQLGISHPMNLLAKEAYFRVKKQAFVIAFDTVGWYMLIGIALTTIPILFLKKPESLDTKHVAGE
ncbi:MAG TPA: DHA2 family efflux MFS transporter permease subunit [bacterium]|nr:DHA2 family efflux MFS transporter permease subunit [bacterium]